MAQVRARLRPAGVQMRVQAEVGVGVASGRRRVGVRLAGGSGGGRVAAPHRPLVADLLLREELLVERLVEMILAVGWGGGASGVGGGASGVGARVGLGADGGANGDGSRRPTFNPNLNLSRPHPHPLPHPLPHT